VSLAAVTVCSGGLRVFQRGADRTTDRGDGAVEPPGANRSGVVDMAERADLTVGNVAAVTPPAGPPVEAHRSDGVTWRRHWAGPDRLVIDFVDVALVEVDHARGIVTFDRRLPDEAEQHLLFDHVLPLVLAHGGALVLHGAVVSLAGRGAVLVGSSGAGKSTLTAYAWQHGWTVGGDDGAVLHATRPPTVEPTYATVRLTPTSAELLGIVPDPLATVVGKLRLAGDGERTFRQDCVELGLVAVVEPAPAGETARFERLGGVAAHAELFGSTFHAELSGQRLLPAVVHDLATIVETTEVGRLFVPRGLHGPAQAEHVLRSGLGSPR
jgi:hypothetical protein